MFSAVEMREFGVEIPLSSLRKEDNGGENEKEILASKMMSASRSIALLCSAFTLRRIFDLESDMHFRFCELTFCKSDVIHVDTKPDPEPLHLFCRAFCSHSIRVF